MPRRRLIGDLAAVHDDVPLILLIAAPGYGKTLTLRQWAAADPRPFAWLDIEPDDAEPARLLRRIARALHPLRPAGDPAWRALSQPTGDMAEVGPAFFAGSPGRPWLLVLDNLQVIRNSPAQRAVIALAERLPSGCHLVVAARTRLGLHIGGLRAEGRCAEFGPDELRLSTTESLDVIHNSGVRLAPDRARALARRLGGWPAGVYLSALTLQGRADVAHTADRLSGADPYLSEYFCDVVLAAESADTVRFLMRTALLDPMSAGLCDAALRRHGSGQTLAGLAARNVFVAPVDSAVRSYRYHPTFREMLLAELRRREPAAEKGIHQRAAAWYERREQTDTAVRHAAAAGDLGSVERLVGRYARRLVDDGRAEAVAATLDTLGRDAIDKNPGLAAQAGWVYAFAGRRSLPATCLAAATAAIAPDKPRAMAAVDRLRVALAPGGVDNMLGYARRAARPERPGSDWYQVTTVLLGVAEELTGNTVLAMTRYVRAARADGENRMAAALALAGLAWQAADAGDDATATAYAKESADHLGAGRHAGGWSALTHLICARVALTSGDHSAWESSIDQAGPAIRSARAFPWLAAAASIRLTQLLLEAGEVGGAREAAAGARLALAELGTSGVLAERFRAATTELNRRSAGTDTENVFGLTTAELRVLHLLPTHLTLSQIAEDMRLSRNTVKTQVAAVYRKLNAPGRAEAVRQGRDAGLLG
ncbi:LuxR C-terminal-related transcriptional regulator [Actinoplanes sp. M2I2]|uniref:LuxR C-terminal-related transcriptional regulator n=1 Tax=Actinoplanes sp. M2I2 TaxID=1734444 RepID=UPI00201FF2BF|nr:LuxR C-terminal-related transcriptional regulator [Actinoplanes sp. M2I2]